MLNGSLNLVDDNEPNPQIGDFKMDADGNNIMVYTDTAVTGTTPNNNFGILPNGKLKT